MSIYVNVLGCGKPLVFFHGWGFNHQIWNSLVPQLQENYQLFLVDLPGFGLSSFCNWEIFKASLLEQLPRQFAIVGWSLGGLYATRLAVEEKTRVTHLLNVATSPYFLQAEGWPGIESSILHAFHQQLLENPEKMLKQFVSLQLQNVKEPIIFSDYFSKEPKFFQGLEAGLDALRTWDMRHLVATLRIPVSYLFGRLDAIVPRHLMPTMQNQYVFNFINFSKAAHIPFLSHPQEFLLELNEFLA